MYKRIKTGGNVPVNVPATGLEKEEGAGFSGFFFFCGFVQTGVKEQV